MDISVKRAFLFKGQEIILFRLSNASGAYVEVLNYGATITSIVVPDKTGQLNNVVLSYDRLEDYFTDTFYLGSTIGRFANRISNARFSLNSRIYHLDKNDNQNSNHGGFYGFNQRIYNCKIYADKLELSLESSDGEGGFPGNLNFYVTYKFEENNELVIEYRAISDKITPVNFTNHTYFNLGKYKKTAINHKLKINSDKYLEMDNDFLPTGKISLVNESLFDFSKYRSIDEMMSLKNDPFMRGYNHYFIKKEDDPVISLLNEETGYLLEVSTSMPGIMFYTGDYLSGHFHPCSGLCFEAHYYPDALNHPDFVANILFPDKESIDKIIYRFDSL